MNLMQNPCLFSNAKSGELVHYRFMKTLTIKIKSIVDSVQKRHRHKKLIGVVGVVTQRVQPGIIGEIRIPKPVGGKDLWAVESYQQSRMGRLVKVIDVKNSTTLVVERFDG